MLTFLATRWSLAATLALLLAALVAQDPLGAAFGAADVYELPASAVLPKDLFVVANTAVIDGEVRGNLAVIARRVVVRGAVGGTTNLLAARIELQGARVGVVRTIGAAQIEPLAGSAAGPGRVLPASLGRVLPASLAPQAARQDEPAQPEAQTGLGSALLTLAGFAALAAILLALTPRSLISPAEALHERPWRTLLVGLLSVLHFMLLPLATILLALLVAYFWSWFPATLLVVFVLAGFGLLWFLSPLVTGVWAGRWLNRAFGRAPHDRLALVLGVVLVAMVAQLPALGWVVSLASFVLAVGAVAVAGARAGAGPVPQLVVAPEPPHPAGEGVEG
ncbi:MAG: hypothetical protein HGA45_06340 [Chloroflexales bacterium]|nr:hypothetical protein [Chloroflexales bacterium]